MTIRYAYTDYPFTELGDTPGQLAPVRRVKVHSYDGNKCCVVEFVGYTKMVFAEVKSGYLYDKPERLTTRHVPRRFSQRLRDMLPRYCLLSEWLEARDIIRNSRRSQ